MDAKVVKKVDGVDTPIFAIHIEEVSVHFIYLLILTIDAFLLEILTEHISHFDITSSEGSLQKLVYLKLAIKVERAKRLSQGD